MHTYQVTSALCTSNSHLLTQCSPNEWLKNFGFQWGVQTSVFVRTWMYSVRNFLVSIFFTKCPYCLYLRSISPENRRSRVRCRVCSDIGNCSSPSLHFHRWLSLYDLTVVRNGLCSACACALQYNVDIYCIAQAQTKQSPLRIVLLVVSDHWISQQNLRTSRMMWIFVYCIANSLK